MPRVQVFLNGLDTSLLEKLAKNCKGEFFGTWDKWATFGFAHGYAARMFLKAAEKQFKTNAVMF